MNNINNTQQNNAITLISSDTPSNNNQNITATTHVATSDIVVNKRSLFSRIISDKYSNSPSFDALIDICNMEDKNLAVTRVTTMLNQCDYKTTQKWLLSFVLASPVYSYRFYIDPITYAYDGGNLTIAKKILQIMEEKHAEKYKNKTTKTRWITSLSVSDKKICFIIQTVIKIYLKDDINLQYLEPFFKKHFSLIVFSIRKAIYYEALNGLKTLLTIANNNPLYIEKLHTSYNRHNLNQIDILRGVFSNKTTTAKLAILKIFKSFDFSLSPYMLEIFCINDYDICKLFLIDTNNCCNLYIGNQTIVNYTMAKKSYDATLTLISLGADINSTLFNSNCVAIIFWAIYYKNINMLDILLALGAQRFHEHTLEEECELNYISTVQLQSDVEFKENMDNMLINPQSLARLASVNIAKNLILKGKDDPNYSFNDMKLEMAQMFPAIANEINSIEDIFSLNILFKKS